jgi:NAD+ synthetase
MSIKNPEKLVNLIVNTMKKQAAEANTNKAEVDISGGIDSAVVVALSCLAFGPKNVIGVYSSINSSEESRRLAGLLAAKFGFRFIDLDLTSVYEEVVSKVRLEFAKLGLEWPSEKENPTVFGGFRSCLRAPVGRFVNRVFGGGIRQGTGNRDEDEMLRFYQKGGDGEVDCNWIGGLFKSEVWELAEYLGIPQQIIDVEPTPDLWGSETKHSDEDELKEITGVDLTYGRPNSPMGTIEWAIRENDKIGIITSEDEHCDSVHKMATYTPSEWRVILAIRKMEKITRHKAELPPIITRKQLLSARVVL